MLFMFHVCLCYALLSLPCGLVVTCCDGLDSWLSCVLCFCMFLFPCGVLGRVWYLVVSIPDLCLFIYIK